MACLLIMFFNGRLAMPYSRREDVRHATLLFCVGGDNVQTSDAYERSIIMTKQILLAILSIVATTSFAATAIVNGIEWTYSVYYYIERTPGVPERVTYAQYIEYRTQVTVTRGSGGLGVAYANIHIGDGTNAAISVSTEGHVEVPSYIDGDPVVCISANAFSNCTAITSVTVPNEVRHIEESAFTGCSGITEMRLPFVGKTRGLDCVRDAAFGVIFGERSYDGGTMTRQNSAGYWYSGGTHDAYCIPSKLRSLTITDETIISHDACVEMRNLRVVSLPSTLIKIGDGAFNYCTSLRDIIVPSSVQSIGSSAFRNCISMTNAVISAGVTTIHDHTFCDCWQLSSISLPESLTVLEDESFKGTAFTTIPSMPSLLALSGEGVFRNCNNLQSANLPESVRDIGVAAFERCTALTNVIIGSCVTNIGAWAFHECVALEAIAVPSSVKTIGSCAFNVCTNLSNISLSEGLEILGVGAFKECTALQDINLPESVVDLGREDPYRVLGNVFYGCTSLRNVKLPSGLKFLPNGTFGDCKSLALIIFSGDAPNSVEASAFYGVPKTCRIEVPVGASGWPTIPGMWQGFSIDYAPFNIPTGEPVAIVPAGGQMFTAADVAAFVAKATPGNGREGQSASFFKAVGRIAEDGSVVIEPAIDEEAVGLPETANEVLKASMSAVDFAANDPVVTLPAASVKDGFYYGIAAAGSLDALGELSPPLSRASGEELQLSVVKPADDASCPTKDVAFFKIVISDAQ